MTVPRLISVVVTTFNRSDALLAVLGGLSRQTDRDFEVIVADDGSRDDQQQQLFQSSVAQALKVVHVWHPDVGFTASRIRNRGVSVSRGDYIIFLDGDCVPEVDFVARHRLLAHEGCYVNGSRVLLTAGFTRRVLQESEQIVGRSTAYWLLRRLCGDASKLTGLLRLPDWKMRLQGDFSWKGIRSCNMGVWMADFARVDGFDESFVGWGHEDADFVLRLHHTGLRRKNGFCATEVFHLWHREAERDHESQNAAVVRQRSHTNLTLPTIGYAQCRPNDDAVISRLG